MHTILYLGTDPVHYASQGRAPGHLIHYPVIKVVPRPADHPELLDAYRDLDLYTHIIFTSKNAVKIFFSHLETLKKPWQKKTVIAIGEVTAEHLALRGVPPQFVSRIESQEGLVQLLSAMDLKDAYFFMPRSSQSRPVIAQFFQEKGIRYQACDLYDTETQMLRPKPDLKLVDEIVFTSPSTVRAFLEIFGKLPKGKKLTAIGPVTQKALEQGKGTGRGKGRG